MKKTTRNIIIIVAAVIAAIGIVLAIVLPITLRHSDERYTVTFESNGGSAVESITNVAYNTLITEPTAPTKEGHTFAGWFSNAKLTKQWIFDKDKVTSNITLYAKWIYNETSGLLMILNQETNTYTVGGIGDAKNVEDLAIPETYKGLPVTTIAQNAFAKNTTIKTVFIPDNITAILGSAFIDCTNLQSVTLPSGLTEIAKETFDGCGKLSSINFPASLTTIGENAFTDCVSLVAVNLPASLRTLGEKAFSGCKGIETLTVDAGNTFFYSRDNGVESNCIISITSQDGKTVNTVVVGCKNSVIPINSSRPVTVIGKYAFIGCRTLQRITIPSTVVTIDDEAFNGCLALESIVIPSSVKKIGVRAFANCENLENITFGSPAEGSENTGIQILGQEAFSYCFMLKSIHLPGSLTNVGRGLFCGCNTDGMYSVTYGGDVNNILTIMDAQNNENSHFKGIVHVTSSDNGSTLDITGLA